MTNMSSSTVTKNFVLFVLYCITCSKTSGFTPVPTRRSREQHGKQVGKMMYSDDNDGSEGGVSRRSFFWRNLEAVTVATGAAAASAAWVPTATAAEETITNTVPMRLFVDPVGLFAVKIPQQFFAIRRSAKGDLPDAKTGQGRRGSSIFTAGDMSKAEVVAVERFPTRLLLEENGVEATGDLSTFGGLGEPAAVATLLNLRRERDKPTQSNTVLDRDSVRVSPDNKELYFRLKSEIQVQKPELLMEQYGVSQLFRVTLAKASLQSNDGNIMAVFASALEQDFKGPDGVALQEVVDSFTVTDQSSPPS